MQIVEVVFSPTGGTQKVADILSSAFSRLLNPDGEEEVLLIDLADPFIDESDIRLPQDSFAIIAMPCFGGRVPEVAMKRLEKVNGLGSRCVVVNVYGNRAFDDALAEMEDGAVKSHFHVVAAIAAIAQHSIMSQFATGRPDDVDKTTLGEFAKMIVEHIGSPEVAYGDSEVPKVPGKRLYKTAGAVPLVPKVSKECISCGRCAESCPVAAIDTLDYKSNKKLCIACMRCVKICPQDARSINQMMVKLAAKSIKSVASVSKECELFL